MVCSVIERFIIPYFSTDLSQNPYDVRVINFDLSQWSRLVIEYPCSRYCEYNYNSGLTERPAHERLITNASEFNFSEVKEDESHL